MLSELFCHAESMLAFIVTLAKPCKWIKLGFIPGPFPRFPLAPPPFSLSLWDCAKRHSERSMKRLIKLRHMEKDSWGVVARKRFLDVQTHTNLF